MLISESMQKIIRVLLNARNLTTREIAKKAGVSLGICAKIVNQLEKIGYISRERGKLEVRNLKKLLNAWAYTVSIKELKKTEFIGAENPQYLIKKISSIADKNNLEYCFTMFAGAELVCPLVGPNEIHLYILESEEKKWKEAFKKEKIFQAEKGNIICFLANKSYFFEKVKSRDASVASLPQLYVDLFSVGGRGEELAEELFNKHLKEAKENV